MDNPYRAPQSDLSAATADDADIAAVYRGQKEIIYAIVAQMVAMAAAPFEPVLGRFLAIAALGIAVYGLWRLGKGLHYATWLNVLLVLMMLLPLLNLLTLLIVNAQATRRLRAAGYKVGLVGAYK